MEVIQGEDRAQGTLLPAAVEELIPEDHHRRVQEAIFARWQKWISTGRWRLKGGGNRQTHIRTGGLPSRLP